MTAQRQEAHTRQTVLPGKILSSSTYETPRYAILQDDQGVKESVRLLGLDDVENHSPCYRFVGDSLITRWESTNKFLVIDPTCLPASTDALQTMAQMLTGNQTGQNFSGR